MPISRFTLLFALALFALGAPVVTAQVAPSSTEQAKYTGLHAAAQTGDLADLKRMIAQKSELNSRDGYGRTPLMVATFAGHLHAAAALIDAGADTSLLENDKYDALTIAAVDGNAEMVKLLIAKGARADLVTSVYDGTALIAAAHLGHVEVVKALIDGKAPLDHVNNLNWTALIEAIVLGDGGKNHTEVVRALVAAGADVNLPDGQGRTPLALANSRGYKKIIGTLEKAGAK